MPGRLCRRSSCVTLRDAVRSPRTYTAVLAYSGFLSGANRAICDRHCRRRDDAKTIIAAGQKKAGEWSLVRLRQWEANAGCDLARRAVPTARPWALRTEHARATPGGIAVGSVTRPAWLTTSVRQARRNCH